MTTSCPSLPRAENAYSPRSWPPKAYRRSTQISSGFTRERWLEAARVLDNAVRAGGYDVWDDGQLHLHQRSLIALAESGVLEAQGDLYRPRFSEVRLAQHGPTREPVTG